MCITDQTIGLYRLWAVEGALQYFAQEYLQVAGQLMVMGEGAARTGQRRKVERRGQQLQGKSCSDG